MIVTCTSKYARGILEAGPRYKVQIKITFGKIFKNIRSN